MTKRRRRRRNRTE